MCRACSFKTYDFTSKVLGHIDDFPFSVLKTCACVMQRLVKSARMTFLEGKSRSVLYRKNNWGSNLKVSPALLVFSSLRRT